MTKPNLIYIMADQMRRDALGFEGVLPVKTPAFDEFSKEALVFNNAISTCPLCTPYRGMLFTGRYPLSTGMVTNCQSGLKLALSEDEVCISDVLKEQAYQTAYLGKWHLDNPSRNESAHPVDGAERWDCWTSPEKRHGIDYWYAYNAWDNHFKPHYWTGENPQAIEIEQWSVEHETDKALQWMEDTNRENPFALFLSWNPPHPPYVAPDEYLQMYEDTGSDEQSRRRRAYYAAISSLDVNFKRLLNWLDENDLTDDTIVVFTADHGDMLGDHDLYGKTTWFREALDVPYLIRWPGVIRAGRTDALLGTADIMPGLLELMKLPVPETVEGTSFLSESKEDSAFFAVYANPGEIQAVGQKPTPYTLAGAELKAKGIDWRSVGIRGIRTGRYTFVADRGNHTEEVHWSEEKILKEKKPIDGSKIEYRLYDNQIDPEQNNPIISNRCDSKLLIDLRDKLSSYLLKQNDPFQL